MFRKRPKKHFPPGTFIPRPARICAIIHLCIAFTLLLWYASQPFVGHIFAVKSRLLYYQDIMGIPSRTELPPEALARLERNAARFAALPEEQQLHLQTHYQTIQKELQCGFLSKMADAIRIFALQLPPFELAWLLLSLILPILLLKKVEGASQTVWLLPLLVALYAADNRWHTRPASPPPDAALFPTEEVLIARYGSGELSSQPAEQYSQLLDAWQRYLILEWTHADPSRDPAVWAMQAEEGEFLFTLERVKLREGIQEARDAQQPLGLLAAYFFWNVLFAFTATRHAKNPIPNKL